MIYNCIYIYLFRNHRHLNIYIYIHDIKLLGSPLVQTFQFQQRFHQHLRRLFLLRR